MVFIFGAIVLCGILVACVLVYVRLKSQKKLRDEVVAVRQSGITPTWGTRVDFTSHNPYLDKVADSLSVVDENRNHRNSMITPELQVTKRGEHNNSGEANFEDFQADEAIVDGVTGLVTSTKISLVQIKEATRIPGRFGFPSRSQAQTSFNQQTLDPSESPWKPDGLATSDNQIQR